jgi:hypothetical protein
MACDWTFVNRERWEKSQLLVLVILEKGTQYQTDQVRYIRELISVPCLGTKARLLSFNRMQSRVVTGLLA